jgi:hypothetical protein
LARTVLHAGAEARGKLRSLSFRRRRARSAETAAQRAWDARYCVDTSGKARIEGLSIVGDRAHGHFYVGTDPEAFASAMSVVLREIDADNYTFVDFGSGKGKALLLAAGYSFRAVIGVEFALELHEVADANIRSYRGPVNSGEIRSVHADAAAVPIPPGPLVLYFFNPFSESILSRVLENVRRSLEVDPRDAWAIYNYPEAHRPLDESPDWMLSSDVAGSRIYRARAGR